MTISIQTARIQYDGNGVTTVRTYPFKIWQNSDLLVIITNAAGLETTLTLDVDYTVSGAGNPSGGSITLSSAALNPTGSKLTILSNIPILQESDYVDGEGFTAESVEDTLDKQTRIVQQINEKVARSIALPVSRTDDLKALSDALIVVADLSANVTTVAGISADVSTVAAIKTDVQTVAYNVTDITNFSDVYQGPKAVAPTTRNDLTPLQVGDLYFDTALVPKRMQVYSGTAWQDAYSAYPAITDGDKGDIVVSGSGSVWEIDAGAVSSNELADGAVGTTELGNSAVTTIKQADEFLLPLNCSLAASVAANALTISLKTAAGNDPSATDVVKVPFRNATATNGSIAYGLATAATSLTISAGSTLGGAANEYVRIHVWAINNAGTVELAAGCLSVATGVSLLSSAQRVLQQVNTTIAEGGAGGADNVGAFYSVSVRSNVAFAYLGYIEIQHGGTAGNWSNAPSKVATWRPGQPLPGDVVQRGWINGISGSSTTSLTYVDVTNSSFTITPAFAANKFRVQYMHNLAIAALTGTNVQISSRLMRDSTALNSYVSGPNSGGGNVGGFDSACIQAFDAPQTNSAVTYKLQHLTGNASASATTSAISAMIEEIWT